MRVCVFGRKEEKNNEKHKKKANEGIVKKQEIESSAHVPGMRKMVPLNFILLFVKGVTALREQHSQKKHKNL